MGFKIPEQPNVGLEEGVWTEYEGSKFKIAYAANVRFMRAKARAEQPFRRQIEKGTIDPADQKRCLVKAMAQAILLDWSGVEGANDEEVPYSESAALSALTNDEAFREFVMEFSMSLQNFKDEDRAHEGNS